ncbi:MAG: phosphotransferase family protein [Spirochaetia bacterium]|nr:phosphotransferase family protein [Spirochaetia bacterium]
MTLPDLQAKLEAYLSKRLGGRAAIQAMKPLSGGACQDNYLVDLSVSEGKEAGDHRLVLRTDKGGSLYASLARADEFGVVDLAHKAGVKTPRPMWLERDTSVIGHPFYFMERINGRADGRFIVKDRSIQAMRDRLPTELARSLFRIHTVTPESCTDAELKRTLTRHEGSLPNSVALSATEEMRRELAQLPDAHPALELGLNWLEKTAPPTDKVVLVHGDFRTGNFMVTPTGLEGVVDWEFAHWGDRHEDIAWLCMRDWRFGKISKEAGGFAGRQEFYDAYSSESGIKVDPEKVRYWEVMGNARWAIGSAQQTERHLSGRDKGIELAAIGRRMSEMEFEMMRLIEDAK